MESIARAFWGRVWGARDVGPALSSSAFDGVRPSLTSAAGRIERRREKLQLLVVSDFQVPSPRSSVSHGQNVPRLQLGLGMFL